MTYTLAIGDRAYSSWSLRGWLLFDAFGIPVKVVTARLYSDDLARVLADFAPARTVPALAVDGAVVTDSLAIAEELASREGGIWPSDPPLRAIARSLAAEMHSGFSALRSHCAMNLRVAYADCAPGAEVLADLARIDAIWTHAMARSGGPWLCGEYSAADVFFAPVAARIAGHSLPTAHPEYVAAHLAHPSFRRWRAMGMVDGADQAAYARDWPQKDWPMPVKPATACEGPAVNDACPYSGKPVTDFLEFDGRVYGFCNPFCRDKTMADPEAWPAFMRIVNLS
ncbi:glutathione S-transferase [Cereibacter sp. SYSU M97828]|nr:glutathione S-transferase [Cereibacter flavus]